MHGKNWLNVDWKWLKVIQNYLQVGYNWSKLAESYKKMIVRRYKMVDLSASYHCRRHSRLCLPGDKVCWYAQTLIRWVTSKGTTPEMFVLSGDAASRRRYPRLLDLSEVTHVDTPGLDEDIGREDHCSREGSLLALFGDARCLLPLPTPLVTCSSCDDACLQNCENCHWALHQVQMERYWAVVNSEHTKDCVPVASLFRDPEDDVAYV
jgi:hypothetical protein